MDSPDLYKNVFALLPTPSCLIDLNSLSIVHANKEFESGLGFSMNELLLPISLDSIVKGGHPSIIQDFSTNAQEIGSRREVSLVLSGKLSINHSFDIHGYLTLINSSTLLLSGSLKISSIPVVPQMIRESDDSFKSGEIPLSLKNLVDLFKNAAIGVHCTSADGVVIWANDYFLKLVGYEASEYIGQKVSKITVPDENNAEYIAGIMSRIRQGETVNNIRTKMRAKDGTIKYVIADSGAYFRPDGTFSHTKTFIRDDYERIIEDITHRENVERLEAIAREKDRFMRIMFHELRTPLNVFSLGIHNLQSSTHDAMNSQSIADLMHQVNKFTGIMDDLSFVMMFDSDNVMLPRPSAHTLQDDLKDICQTLGIIYSLGKFTQQKIANCQFKLTIAKEVPNLLLYDKSLLRVFLNLLSNAIKYCTPGGEVEMSISYQTSRSNNDDEKPMQDTLFVTILNSVSQELDLVYTNKLFQKYLRMLPPHSPLSAAMNDESGKTDFSTDSRVVDSLISSDGLGLGLYVSYNIIQSLGGLLECKSTNNQAYFGFSVPISCPIAAVPSMPPPVSSPSTYIKLEELWAHVTSSEVGSRHVIGLRQKVSNAQQVLLASASSDSIVSVAKKGRILVVDDSPICRKVLIRALESNDYNTDCACDGQEAVQKMSVMPCSYSAVLMDLRMPIMDGITATKICKSMGHTSHVPIIIVTAEMGEEVRATAMEAKANYFLSKPVLVSQLLSTLEELIAVKK